MGFVLAPKSVIKTKVVVQELGDFDEVKELDFIAHFKKLPADEFQEALKQAKDRELSDSDLLKQNVVGWEGVSDAEGNVVEFSKKSLAQLIGWTEARNAMGQAFTRVNMGLPLAKNS